MATLGGRDGKSVGKLLYTVESTGFDGCTKQSCWCAMLRHRKYKYTHTNKKVVEQDFMVSEIFLLQLNFREEMRDVASEMVRWMLSILILSKYVELDINALKQMSRP